MNNSKDIVAIIPARSGSKGIPKKNIMNFCGKPLIVWTIEQARESRMIGDVYVSSDDYEILKISEDAGAKGIRRPVELATDTATSEQALLHAISEIEKHKKIDVVVFLQATSPVREPADIDSAIELFFTQQADSLFSASIADDLCLWEISDGELKSVTYDYKNRSRRQDRKPYYLENGSIYIFKPEILKRYNNRLGGKIIMYIMPFWKSFEIDTFESFELVRSLFMYMCGHRQHCFNGKENGNKLK